MIRSMTGFAQAETATPQGVLIWELRSVNNRYLEVQLRLPELFRPIENEVRQLAAARLGRGRIEASLNLRNPQGQPAGSQLNLVRPARSSATHGPWPMRSGTQLR